MKPAPFAYKKARSTEEAVAPARRTGRAPARRWAEPDRHAQHAVVAPALLIDINGIGGLDGIAVKGGMVEIGALTRHAAAERSDVIAKHAPLIARAMPHIGHPAIRNRGTLGGSIAFADPAAELPACLLALDGEVEATGPKGKRTIKAEDFFKGLFETALAPNEMLTAIRVPAAGKDTRTGFAELARRHGDYAMVGLGGEREGRRQRPRRRAACLFRRRRDAGARDQGRGGAGERQCRRRGRRARPRSARRRAGDRRGEETSCRRAAAPRRPAADGGAADERASTSPSPSTASACAGASRRAAPGRFPARRPRR